MALAEIDSRLDVGMNVGELGERLGDAKVVYDRIPLDDVDEECKKRVGSSVSGAFDEYVAAHDRWRTCIFDEYDCELDDIEGKLQARWENASFQLDVARSALRD